MVRHQTVGPDLRPGLSAKFGQQLHIEPIVFLLLKDIDSTNTALGYMMGNTRNDCSCHARHISKLATSLPDYKK